MTSGGAVLSRTGVLVRAQEPRVAEEWVEDMRRTLQALEHEEAKGCTARQAWRARTHELEIRVHKLRLLQEHVGGSNAAWVRRSSPHLPLDLPLMKGQPPVLDRPLSFPYHPVYGHIHHPYESPYASGPNAPGLAATTPSPAGKPNTNSALCPGRCGACDRQCSPRLCASTLVHLTGLTSGIIYGCGYPVTLCGAGGTNRKFPHFWETWT